MLGQNENIVLFKPRRVARHRWQQHSLSKKMYLTPQEMADEISGYPRGTVTSIYLTSDGGGRLSDITKMVGLLKDHVEVVNQNVAVKLAIEMNKSKK